MVNYLLMRNFRSISQTASALIRPKVKQQTVVMFILEIHTLGRKHTRRGSGQHQFVSTLPPPFSYKTHTLFSFSFVPSNCLLFRPLTTSFISRTYETLSLCSLNLASHILTFFVSCSRLACQGRQKSHSYEFLTKQRTVRQAVKLPVRNIIVFCVPTVLRKSRHLVLKEV
jgi:hypothetical protein